MLKRNEVMKKSITFIILALTLALAACDNGDDLNEIFRNRNWTLSFFMEGSNINSVKGDYKIIFYENVFTVTTPNKSSIEGYWEADNKSHAFRCRQVRVTSGTIAGDTTALKMKNILEKASGYSGDANSLQIIEMPNKFMQFHNK